MTVDEMICQLLALNSDQGVPTSALPHGSNLLYQLRNIKINGKQELFERIFPLYIRTRLMPYDNDNLKNYIRVIAEVYNAYMDYLSVPNNNPCHHTADFASSVLPEMLCTVFREVVNKHSQNLEVSAQKDLTILCVFSISDGGSIRFKNKRVDVAVVKPCNLEFNGVSTELSIPLVVAECKTNLDKNMISGIEHSVSDLKKTFPECRYFVVAGLSDFDYKKTNYASSGID